VNQPGVFIPDEVPEPPAAPEEPVEVPEPPPVESGPVAESVLEAEGQAAQPVEAPALTESM
jgi:hypothetical protein